ncbi:MAG: hypothetical protein VCA36_12840 [Opitutales bacterium]
MQGDYSFEFQTLGNGHVQVEGFSGKSGSNLFRKIGENREELPFAPKPRSRLFQEVLRGSSTYQALLRACDQAVLKTTGNQGFFAGKLVYVSKLGKGKEVFIADTLFTRASQKTTLGSDSCNASWSADGKKILFTSNKRIFNNVYLMDVVAKSMRPIADYRGSNLRGVQSPVGGRVAYILSVPETGNAELWLANFIGAKPRRITRNHSNESGPCWSPDGRRLIVTSDFTGKPQLFEVSLLSGRLTRIRTNISSYCTEAAWNPTNPNRVAFTAAVGGGFQLAEYNFASGKSRLLTRGPEDALQPEWANDGRHLFFTERTRAGTTRLMILDAGTSKDAAIRAVGLAAPMAKRVKLYDGFRLGNCSQARFFYEAAR